jgi:hypothetical protein
MEQVQYDLLFRWFIEFFNKVVAIAEKKCLLSGEYFSVAEQETQSDHRGQSADSQPRRFGRRPNTTGTPALQHPVRMS